MKQFWSDITDGQFRVCCTGQTVYVYNAQNTELARFKDLPYAYTAAISPKGDIFVIKSTDGRLAVYSLSDLQLLRKFRFSKVNGAQDDNFCFSPDGARFYHIERHGDSCKTALSVYHTPDFSLEKRLFADDTRMVLSTIEYDTAADSYYLLGFCRGQKGAAERYFVGRLGSDDTLTDTVRLSEREYDFYHAYCSLRQMGFTEKAFAWSPLKNDFLCDAESLRNRKHSLAKLWAHYHNP